MIDAKLELYLHTILANQQALASMLVSAALGTKGESFANKMYAGIVTNTEIVWPKPREHHDE